MDGTTGEAKVKSLAKALKILSCFTIQEPVLGVTELAARIGVSKSNIHNILSTYTSMGYLERLPDGRYRLGLKILEYAFIINQQLGYPNAIYDILVDTAGKTGEIVYFGLPYGDKVLYLYVAHPADRMGVLPYRDILGETAPFYCTGIGKAMLAHMPEEEWLSRIPEERRQYQPNTITDLDAILEELRRTRRRGYAIDNSERDPNVRCVGVPVYNSGGSLVAGISTSGPSVTMTDRKLLECAGILQNAALKMRERIYR
ncbi:IclR family transcriptional regulator [uncultured Oscillibacter sp.]|uniref:IclR family transcriptional regulator n=1 Tax=uncultured Oscillibacter sp. TaxID=876091 RepID=UPI0025DF45C5|nr:IclR family transcriptional regulator [uncultured Oscillibacter sp.]